MITIKFRQIFRAQSIILHGHSLLKGEVPMNIVSRKTSIHLDKGNFHPRGTLLMEKQPFRLLRYQCSYDIWIRTAYLYTCFLPSVYVDSPANGRTLVSSAKGKAQRCITSLLTASYVRRFLTLKAYSCCNTCTYSLFPSSSSLSVPGMKFCLRSYVQNLLHHVCGWKFSIPSWYNVAHRNILWNARFCFAQHNTP